MSPIDLPDTWLESTFGELNEFSSRSIDPSQFPDETFELYSVPSFPSLRPEHALGRAIGSTKQTVAPGDVLVCKINPRINRVWQVKPSTGLRQIGSSEWIGFRAADMEPRYFRHYFSSPAFRELVCSDVTGVGGSLTRAQPKNVATFAVPVAPAKEQQRIADELDTLLARVNACNDRFDAIPALLKRFRQAVLEAAISDELSADLAVGAGDTSSDFPMTSIVDVLAEPLRNGKSVRDGDGLRVLRLTALRSNGVDLEETKRGDWTAVRDTDRFVIHDGDYLVSRGNGSKDLVGRGALVSGCAKPIAFPDTMIRFRPSSLHMLPDYLKHVWNSEGVRAQIARAAKTTAGIWKVSQTDLENIRLPLPSLEQQTEIVRRVEALFSLADRIEARCTTARTHAQRLAPQLLAKAFRGELVPQDPTDEPASVLLARIAAERSAVTTPLKTRKPRMPRAVRAPKETAAMTKSRQDADVSGQPYLAKHLRRLGGHATAEALFKSAELPVADFYKQLAWEVAQGHVLDGDSTLGARDAD